MLPSGPCPAKIMIVAEYPDEQSLLKGTPLSGPSGQELDRMLNEAGILRSTTFCTYVCRVRPPNNDISVFISQSKKEITSHHRKVRDKDVLPQIADGIELLTREIELCRPNVIIAVGNLSVWALTGNWGTSAWRGSRLLVNLPSLNLDYSPKVIPTYRPQDVFAIYSKRPVTVHDLRTAKKESETREYDFPKFDFITSPSFGTVIAILRMLQTFCERAEGLKLAVDIETAWGHTCCVGLGWSDTNAICIPFTKQGNAKGYWTSEEEFAIRWQLRKLLTNPKCKVVGQNFGYDAQYFYRWDLYIPNLTRDTMIAQHCLFSNMQKGLDYLSSMYIPWHVYWKDEGKDWGAEGNEVEKWTYNCKDCCATWTVDTEQQKAIDKMGLREVHDFQQALWWPVLEAMNRGVRIDLQRRAQYAMKLMEDISAREVWFENVLGFNLNPRSAPQMQKLFYHDLKQPPVKSRKTGNATCDDEALGKIATKEPLLKPLCQKISEYRSLGVFYSTFVQAPLDTDQRMRCYFNIAGTETYRFSSRENAFGTGTNLQNLPKGGEDQESGLELPNIRSLFLPDEGHTIFDIDLSSADLRIVVWESDETEMKQMLREGLDPYTEIAKEFYHDPKITKKDPRRQTFKSFAHGTNYLGTAKGLAERLGLDVHVAEKTQKWYFSRFPRIKSWQERLKEQVIRRRMVQNVFGYRCYIFDRIEGTIFNQMVAWIPQSTVGCLINRGWMNIHRNLPEVKVLLQVHDSLVGQFPSHLGDWATRRIVEECSVELPYSDPLVIPVGIKTSQKNWGECE